MMELCQTKNKYKIYSCSFDGKDYSERFPNELYEQIDYKDCHNDLDNLRLLYSELYHVYEIWKNRPLNDYIGICHYRRFLDFNHHELNDIFQRYDIIVPKAYNFGINVYQQYCRNFDEKNIKIIGAIIKKYYPDYLDVFCDFFNQNRFHSNSIMITSKEIFNDYCTWLFDILSKFTNHCKFMTMDDVKKYIEENASKYHCEDEYHSVLDKNSLGEDKYNEWLSNYLRIYGFLSERLLNVYILKNKLKAFETKMKIY